MMEVVQITCVTEDGIILESESNVSSQKLRQVATEIIRGFTEGVDACDAKIEVENINQMLQEQDIDKL